MVLAIVAVMVAFCALWWAWYRILRMIWARCVVSDGSSDQFVIVATSRTSGVTVHMAMGTTHPPHKKKSVVRAISSWLKIRGFELISIAVNRPGGKTIYRWYKE